MEDEDRAVNYSRAPKVGLENGEGGGGFQQVEGIEKRKDIH